MIFKSDIRTFSNVKFYVNPRKIPKETVTEQVPAELEIADETDTDSIRTMPPGSSSLLLVQLEKGRSPDIL